MATLTDLFPDAHAELRREWEAIRDDFTRGGRINVTLALASDAELEALEARILAFIGRYLADTDEPNRDD